MFFSMVRRTDLKTENKQANKPISTPSSSFNLSSDVVMWQVGSLYGMTGPTSVFAAYNCHRYSMDWGKLQRAYWDGIPNSLTETISRFKCLHFPAALGSQLRQGAGLGALSHMESAQGLGPRGLEAQAHVWLWWHSWGIPGSAHW